MVNGCNLYKGIKVYMMNKVLYEIEDIFLGLLSFLRLIILVLVLVFFFILL